MIETGISYFANGWPHHFERDLEDIQAHNCSYIVHCFSENELVFARKRTEFFFRKTRDAGLGCWADPWAVMGLFGGEQFSAFVPRNPDACQVLSTGQRAPAACPSASETRLAMKLWVDAATNLGADTLLWDEPHTYYPDWDEPRFAPDDAFACFCPRCSALFQSRFGEPLPKKLTPEVRRFQEDLILDFLTEMIAYAKSRGAVNALTMMPVNNATRVPIFWERLAAIPGLDIFGSDPYWYLHGCDCQEYVTAQMGYVMQVCSAHSLVPQFWVQGFGVPAGREAELGLGIDLAVSLGVQSVAAWGMRGNTAWDGVSDNPELVWETIGEAFGKVRGNA